MIRTPETVERVLTITADGARSDLPYFDELRPGWWKNTESFNHLDTGHRARRVVAS